MGAHPLALSRQQARRLGYRRGLRGLDPAPYGTGLGVPGEDGEILAAAQNGQQDGALILPPWIYPPPDFDNIDQLNYVALGAIGVEVTIISFFCPLGHNGIINKIGNNFVGGGWVEGSGAVVWRILVDGTPPPGATNYDSILGSLGSPANPVSIPGFRIYENQLLTLTALNVSVVPAGQLVGGRFVGYDYPREYEDPDIWV